MAGGVAGGQAGWRAPCWARYTGGMDAPEKRRWYCPTPGWLVYGSLAVTGLLFAVGAMRLAAVAQGLRGADVPWRRRRCRRLDAALVRSSP